jgi:hypothetical protein
MENKKRRNWKANKMTTGRSEAKLEKNVVA